MPVYIRSGELNIPAPSISTVDDEDEDGVYLLDPELVVDELPQPFRMIDKVLTGIVEDVWDEIVDREKKREEEMRRVRPPVYNPTSKVEEFTNLSCMVHSNDARYMFVAFETGDLVAFDAVTHDRVAQWVSPDETICFEKLNCAVIGTQTYLLATIDDMGFSRLIVFTGDGFHVIQLLNEQPEGSPKSNAVKFQLSVNGDFCGLSLECEGVSWVDFYKLPRDNWLREIENAQKDALKRAQASSESVSIPPGEANELAAVASEIFEIKFSAITLVQKVKQPVSLSGSLTTNQQEAMEKAGITNSVGNGSAHLLSENHLRLRREVTKKLHKEEMQFLEEKPHFFPHATWHFLLPSRMQHEVHPTGPGFETTPISVCVWWSESNLMQTYSIVSKNVKDPEHKPEIVWPMMATIKATSASVCTSVIAVGLADGKVAVFDRHLCTPRAMKSIEANVSVRDLHVIDGSIEGPTIQRTNPPPLYVLIGLTNGAVYSLDCNNDVCRQLVKNETDKEAYSLFTPIPGLPKIFLIASLQNTVRLCDSLTGHIVCELQVSESLEPMENRISFASEGDVLFAKDDDSCVFSYSLRSFPSLDVYRDSQCVPHPLTFKETISERCQRLLTERTAKQNFRNETLAVRWRMMNRELGILVHLKASIKTPATTSSTPMSRWNQTTGKVMAHNRALTH